MRLERLAIVDTGDPARVRLTAEVSYLDRITEEYWFEVDRKFEDALSTLGNPWLVVLLPLAATIGEPLEITAPVDPLLYEGAQHLMHIWKAWYPRLHVVPLQAPIMREPVSGTGGGKAAAFFSGGVDSFFSIVRHQDNQSSAALRLDDLLFVWGADIAISNSGGFTRARIALERAASELDKRLVCIATNLNNTRWTRTDWAYLSHGVALGAIALAMENRYNNVMIASSFPYPVLRPWGSHPLTDPLLSSSRLRIIHDGAFASRSQKLTYLVHSDTVMRYLRVCWRSELGENCCACEKCYRTMATLVALGAMDRCAAFRWEEFRLEKVGRIYSGPHMPWLRELEGLAQTTGHHDLAEAVRRSMRYSRLLHTLLPIVRKFKGKRGIRRVADELEARLLAGVLS